MSSLRAVSQNTKSLIDRAVHIKISPATRNIGESREILRVLKEFGEISMFKSLRYDPVEQAPHTILAIFQRPEAASKLIEASPFSFIIESPYPNREDVGSKSETTSNMESLADDTHNRLAPNEREFHLTADVSHADHESILQRSTHYWGFRPNKQTLAEEDLVESAPEEGVTYLTTNAQRLPSRIVSKKLEEVANRQTLRQLWEAGMQNASSAKNEEATDSEKP